jgi:heme o synthase
MSIYWRLVRPGLLATVLFSMTIAAWTTPQPPAWPRLIHALLGTALLIGGASAMNQLVEQQSDAKMTRTASRPLPAGQLTSRHVAIFAILGSLVGIAYLAMLQPLVVTLLAALSSGIYVLIYTPLKRRSVWHILPGALAGAIPVLLGAATADAVLTPIALVLFGIVFFWQFPHTAAIGWIYREQYADSMTQVAAVADPSGRLAGRLAFLGAAGLLLVSLIPALLPIAGWPYAAMALSLGLAHLTLAVKFLRRPIDANARALWRMSLIHLLGLLLSLLLTVRY